MVDFASQEDAVSGTDNTRVMTPLRVAEAMDALAGDAGLAGILFVDSTHGNDSTGDGTSRRPYATIQAAYGSGIKDPYNGTTRTFFIRGSVGNLTVVDLDLMLLGTGLESSIVGEISGVVGSGRVRGNGRSMIGVAGVNLLTAAGGAGTASVEPYVPGGDGADGEDGGDFHFESLRVFSGIHVRGGPGGHGGSGFDSVPNTPASDGGRGGKGGNGGTVHLTDCECSHVMSDGGAGGNGGRGGDGLSGISDEGEPMFEMGANGGDAGSGGNGGEIRLDRSKTGYVASGGAAPGVEGSEGANAGGGAGVPGAAGYYGESFDLFTKFSEITSTSAVATEHHLGSITEGEFATS